MMTPVVDVFADLTCPFTHVGLVLTREQLSRLGRPVELRLRAWPLEWVNGTPLDADAVAVKIAALEAQLGTDAFRGFDPATWPSTTIPGHNLTAAARRHSPETGLSVGLALRAALFVDGADIADPGVLAEVATRHGLDPPPPPATQDRADGPVADEDVIADYEEGRRLGVQGSPEFRMATERFFCPSLDLSHDADGGLVAEFDPDGLAAFIAAVAARA